TAEYCHGVVAILGNPAIPTGHIGIVVEQTITRTNDGFGRQSINNAEARRDTTVPGVFGESAAGAARTFSREGDSARAAARARVREIGIEIRETIIGIQHRWIDFPMNAWRNSKF